MGRLLGYGFADQERVTSCQEERVTLVGWNELAAEEGHIYLVPLPPSLSGKPVWKHASKLADKVPYGLLVTLEVAPGVEIPIYEEVRLRLRPRVVVEP